MPRPKGIVARSLLGALLAGIAAADEDAPRLRPDFTLLLRQVQLEDGDAAARNETRLRAEVRVEAEVSTSMRAVLALGTSREGDPVAAEATLGDRLGDPPVGFRVASLAWRPETLSGLTLLAGKLEPPFLLVSDLIWDRDLRPEGAAARWSSAAGDFDFLASGGVFVLRDDDGLRRGERARLYALQAVLRRRWPDKSWAILGAGYYPAEGAEAVAPSEELPADRVRPLEFFAAGTWELYFPVRGVLHGARNGETDAAQEGWLAELTVGRARAVHGMEIGWQWRRIEKNAVFATFADNELWPGAGRTEHRFRLAYRPAPGVRLGFIWSEGRRLDASADKLRGAALEAWVEF